MQLKMDIKKGGLYEEPPPSAGLENYSGNADRPDLGFNRPVCWSAVSFGLRQSSMGHRVLGPVLDMYRV